MVKELHKEDFYLPPGGLSEAQRTEALASFDAYLEERLPNFLGFQAAQDLHYDVLGKYLNCQLNNLGDPYVNGSFTINSKKIEETVLDYFATLWNGTPFDPQDAESCWGYMISMGSTEANLYGLWNARDYLTGKPLMKPCEISEEEFFRAKKQKADAKNKAEINGEHNIYNPVLFYSQDTHYSIIKAARVLGIETFHDAGNRLYTGECPLEGSNGEWPELVPSEEGLLKGKGSINTDALVALVEFFAKRGHPILINFNYGTAFRGAFDDIKKAGERLMPIFKSHHLYERDIETNENPKKPKYDRRHGFWFHVDGALGAAYMPFLEMAKKRGLLKEHVPEFDFRLPYVHSIAMSGHKWIGAPWPCGVYMTKRKYQLKPPDNPEYIGSDDSTFAGSRNGLSALIIWNYLARTSYDNEMRKALRTKRVAEYAVGQFQKLEKKLELEQRLEKNGLWLTHSHPLSLSICFKRVTEDIISKYSLSGETFEVKGDGVTKRREYNHIYAMDHVTEERIDQLIEDLSKPWAFPEQQEMVSETSPESTGQTS